MIWSAMMWEETLYRFNPYTHSGGERHISLCYPRQLTHSNGSNILGIFMSQNQTGMLLAFQGWRLPLI